jgi:hypothetical protein
MADYLASEDDMRVYSDIVRNIAALDLQRDQLLNALSQWEQAHLVAQDPEAPAEEEPTQ